MSEKKLKEYIQISELTKFIQEYVEYSEKYKITLDLYTFQELSLLFAEIDIFDELIGEFDYLKINSKLTKDKCIKMCEIFKEVNTKKLPKKDILELSEFIITLYRRSLDLFRVMALNLRYTKKDQGDYVLEPEPKQEVKGYHFFSPTIALYDLRIEINIVIKTLLNNGETEQSLSKINMIFARYCFLQMRSLGI